MQIEEGFRDVKRERLGIRLNLRRSHCPKQIEVLLSDRYTHQLHHFSDRPYKLVQQAHEQRFQSSSVKERRVLSLWRSVWMLGALPGRLERVESLGKS